MMDRARPSGRVLALIVSAALGCGTDRAPRTAPPMSNPDSLTLVVDVSAPIPIGYGNAWHAEVRKVVAGALADPHVLLSAFETELPCCGPHPQVEVTLRRVPNRPAALAGFVAADGTIWEMVSVKR